MSNLEHQDSIFHSLLYIYRHKLSGCFEAILPNSQTVEVWIYQGKIVTVIQDNSDLKQLIIKHTILGFGVRKRTRQTNSMIKVTSSSIIPRD